MTEENHIEKEDENEKEEANLKKTNLEFNFQNFKIHTRDCTVTS